MMVIKMENQTKKNNNEKIQQQNQKKGLINQSFGCNRCVQSSTAILKRSTKE